ncbi:zinc-binding dehydrogenase [Bacillus sp. ISL-40]|uniref:zinc-binding dehydrogenase n=1 Tax=unclassified Bacillus (in: firmicutes) TaxID=185979 RepID=UPI001BE78859|nr:MULTISPECIES: zinc-binding dehydrogenase [unclassified Bacillus (in: firmicutes)]MBT2696860.1 zinc-binding dehydrogenase [Bacillus sp. ISL-40]MBT2742536.1 zinc-binding dehydrogenase [Bacillus sp. ISL-77]
MLEPIEVCVHAAQVSDVHGKHVAVLGAGPIVLFSACASLALGARTVSISDLKQSRVELAYSCGDMTTWNPLETPASTVLGSNAPDVIIETTGSERSLIDALPYLRKGGNVTMAGLFREEVSVNLSRDLVFKEATFKGIHGRKMWDTWNLMETLILQTKLNDAPAVTHRFQFEDFSEGFRVASTGEAMKVLLYP